MMMQRQKLLLSLLKIFGGTMSSTDLMKRMFLYTQECVNDNKVLAYSFVPYKFGCFSFELYRDREKLIQNGLLVDITKNFTLTPTSSVIIDKKIRDKLEYFHYKYKDLSGDQLIEYVYTKYPYYAIYSEIKEDILEPEHLDIVNRMRQTIESQQEHTLFTIGYEGKSIEEYINLLIKNNIHLLVDVRKNPFSMKTHFNKNLLSKSLAKLNIQYLHMPTLGIESEDRKNLHSMDDYLALFTEYEQNTLNNADDELANLKVLIDKHRRIAITCFEKDHCMCHRGRVAKRMSSIYQEQFQVVHL